MTEQDIIVFDEIKVVAKQPTFFNLVVREPMKITKKVNFNEEYGCKFLCLEQYDEKIFYTAVEIRFNYKFVLLFYFSSYYYLVKAFSSQYT